MSNRCFLYDYGLDFKQAMAKLNEYNTNLLLISDTYIRRDCWDVIRAFVCNYYYISCNPLTRLPQGICKNVCVQYTLNGNCADSFVWLNGLAKFPESDFIFNSDCDDPLWMVAETNPALANVTLDTDECIELTGNMFMLKR